MAGSFQARQLPAYRIRYMTATLQCWRYNIRLILPLTLNPAIDRTISVDRLAFEDRAYIESTGESPGGRGINAACVIHSFGGKSLAIIASGGESGARLQ